MMLRKIKSKKKKEQNVERKVDEKSNDEVVRNDDKNDKIQLVTKQYVYKSIDRDNQKVTCLDADFNDIVFDLDGLNKDLLEKIGKVIEDGTNQKKDVTIIVSEVDKDGVTTRTVSDAKIAA